MYQPRRMIRNTVKDHQVIRSENDFCTFGKNGTFGGKCLVESHMSIFVLPPCCRVASLLTARLTLGQGPALANGWGNKKGRTVSSQIIHRRTLRVYEHLSQAIINQWANFLVPLPSFHHILLSSERTANIFRSAIQK